VERFLDYVKGDFSKKFVTHFYSPVIAGTIFISYLVAVKLYGDYVLPYDDISFLGNAELNPKGWYFWNLGTLLTGLLLVPLQPYFYRRLRKLHSLWGLLASFFLTLSTVGMVGVGAIPETDSTEAIHELNAALAFVGLYAGVLFAGIALLRYGHLKLRQSIPFVVCGLSGPIGFLITQTIRLAPMHFVMTRQSPAGKRQWYLSFSMWEWMLFFSIFADLIIFMLILPDLDDIPENKTRRRSDENAS
jgi:hypothetical protein